ncbi:LPS assembly lipoprotein LptE [Marinimicrobium sp. ABcell2]|uniref:LPS-assembly lipoprotein LptE n=1 Tax=Marinimicrobium sp. ABcell2 TaxID=3069751 RepID=UPI0027B1F4F1|nr:LPS assembly lipoprotein LptE [Marinimicrobium sp. ABcell2]MDQ2077696.1 LPS assembly lipoprotein LptE [Marinimicrobium sp. ABcell2]
MKHLCIFVLVLLTTACGWHLRGTVTLPSTIERLYLSADDPYSPMVAELQQRLIASGVELAPAQVGAPYTLAITEQLQDSRVAGVGVDSLASSYEVTLEVRYDILGLLGEPIAEDLSSIVTRSYESDVVAAGAGAREEAMLLREMRAELAQQILRRLQAEINAAEAAQPTATD